MNFCRKKKVNLILGFSVTAAHISLVTHIKSFIFDDDDDDIQPLITKFVTPFCTELLSPDSLKLKRKRKDTIFYPGYHELAYLHPKRFTIDPSVLLDTGLQPDETFFILRFNTFRAHHDRGKMGFSFDQKIQLINKLKSKGRIFISAERTLEPVLEKYKLTIQPEKIHSLMAYSTLFISDSQTMTSEAAVLGIPSLRCNSIAGRRAYLSEEEDKYGLTFSYHLEEFDKLYEKIDELLQIENLKEEWQTRRLKMLECKIDVTAFWLWFIENYPKTKFELLNTENFWKVFS